MIEPRIERCDHCGSIKPPSHYEVYDVFDFSGGVPIIKCRETICGICHKPQKNSYKILERYKK